MAHDAIISYEGYSIRPEKTTVKGREYTRLTVDFGTVRNGRRLRRSCTSESKAKAAIREHIRRVASYQHSGLQRPTGSVRCGILGYA